jgi:hypothetical protein
MGRGLAAPQLVAIFLLVLLVWALFSPNSPWRRRG